MSTDAARRRHRRTTLCFFGGIFVVMSAAVSLSSHSRSCCLELFDASLATDEGLLWVCLPLTRMTPDARPSTGMTLFVRDPSPISEYRFVWTSGIRHRVPVRDLIPFERMHGRNCLLIGGFGYHVEDRMYDGRPGPAVMLIVPIWFPLFIVFCFLAVVRWRTFSLRFLMLATALSAVTVWLLKLLTLRTAGAE